MGCGCWSRVSEGPGVVCGWCDGGFLTMLEKRVNNRVCVVPSTGSVYGAMRQFEMSMQIERTHIVTFVGVCRTLRTLGQTARLHKFVTR